MQKAAYEMYASEVFSWLHVGRRQLIDKVLQWYAADTGGTTRTVLEIGAGVGQNVAVLGRYGVVDVNEIDEIGIRELKENPDVRSIFTSPLPFELTGHYDIVCAFDVIEHIEDDVAAVQWLADHVKPDGILLLTVPAFNLLFSDHDRALGHYRRYTATSLKRIIPLEMTRLSAGYYNMLLFPAAVATRLAWQARRKLGSALKKQPVPHSGFINTLLGALFSFEIHAMPRRISFPFGLSYYACFRKAAHPG
jgi:SAM-dependent methyltransferase